MFWGILRNRENFRKLCLQQFEENNKIMHGENHEDYRRFSMEKGQGIQMEKMEDYFLSECKSDFLHYEAEIQEKKYKIETNKDFLSFY